MVGYTLDGVSRDGGMKRREFIGLLGGATAAPAGSLVARAQTSWRFPRIGYIAVSGSAMAGRMIAALQQGLSELGYKNGQTIAIEVRVAEGRAERIPELTPHRTSSSIQNDLGSPLRLCRHIVASRA
jgi:hypothetical protein